MPEDKLKKFKEILGILNDGKVSKDDFLKAIQRVLNVMVEVKRRNEQAVKDIEEMSKKALEILTKEIKQKLPIKGKDYFDGKTPVKGKDYFDGEKGDTPTIDEPQIALKASKLAHITLLSHIPTIEQIGEKLPQMGERIRDALELLQGEERLDFSAIKGLRGTLNKLGERRLGGGGLSKIALESKLIDPYTPTGAINGSNKDYVLTKVPNPLTSLKVYLDGQKMKLTTDYTLSGVKVTFIEAPLTNSSVEVEHRR